MYEQLLKKKTVIQAQKKMATGNTSDIHIHEESESEQEIQPKRQDKTKDKSQGKPRMGKQDKRPSQGIKDHGVKNNNKELSLIISEDNI